MGLSDEEYAQLVQNRTRVLSRSTDIGSAQVGSIRPPKYRNQKVMVDGYTFDSKKEAQRYAELKLMQQVGAIRDLELQPSFSLFAAVLTPNAFVQSVEVSAYRADFRYYSVEHGAVIVEDVKSPATATPLYRLKKRLLEANYGIEILET